MKKYFLPAIGMTVISAGVVCLVMLAGCKDFPLTYVGDVPPKNEPRVAADIAYGYNLIHVGENFPDTGFTAPETSADRLYLGLAPDAKSFSVKQIPADLVLVILLNVYCVPCEDQIPVYNDLFNQIAADRTLANRLKMMAVGVGNTEEAVNQFRDKYHVAFPILADPRFILDKALGKPVLPFAVLVRLEKQTERAVVALTYPEAKQDEERVFQDMTALQNMDLAVFQQQAEQAVADARKLHPPMSESEIAAQVKTAMEYAGKSDQRLTEFNKIVFKDRQVYTGLFKGGQKTSRLFAEVIGSPTICNVCQDVFFFYIFNERGALVDFVPLQLTKWGNEKWSAADVKQMHDRLMGRFVFTPFYFNPQLDAVSSATITSAVIFDDLSNGKELFDFLKKQGYIPPIPRPVLD